MEGKSQCPICKRDEAFDQSHSSEDLVSFDCPRCGRFTARKKVATDLLEIEAPLERADPDIESDRLDRHKRTAEILAKSKDPSRLAMLSAFTRTSAESGRPVTLTADWRVEADRFATMTVGQRAELFLRYLGRKSTFLGHEVRIEWETDIACAAVNFASELDYILRYLEQQGLAALHKHTGQAPGYSISPKGCGACQQL